MANSLFDLVMPFVTKIKNMLPLLIVVCLYLLIRGKRKGRIVVLALVLAIAFADLFNHEVLKQFFERFRPCDPRAGLEGVRSLFGAKTSLSFPSNHAANITAAAVVVSYYYRKWIIPMTFIAVLICFTRVYVGVHYPSDVFAGAIVGGAIAALVILVMQRFLHVDLEQPVQEKQVMENLPK